MDGVFDFIGISMSFFLLFPFFYSAKKMLENGFSEVISEHSDEMINNALEKLINITSESEKTAEREEQKAQSLDKLDKSIKDNLDNSINIKYLSDAYSWASITLFFLLLIYFGCLVSNGLVELDSSMFLSNLSDKIPLKVEAEGSWHDLGKVFFVPLLLVLLCSLLMFFYVFYKNISHCRVEIFEQNNMFENGLKSGKIKMGLWFYYVFFVAIILVSMIFQSFVAPFFAFVFALIIGLCTAMTYRTYKLAITACVDAIIEDGA